MSCPDLIRASIISSENLRRREWPGQAPAMTMTHVPMILIGQYNSPFVRRVAIALRLYGLPFEHRPWSTFGDADKIAPYNPLRRVPTLVLDNGEALIESAAILDYLDELVGPDKAMIAARGEARRRQLRIIALATGLGDKAVSLVYERVLRKEQSKIWVERCEAQIGGVLDGAGEGARGGRHAVLVRRAHRPRRHRGRLRAALHRRGASAAVRCALSGADRRMPRVARRCRRFRRSCSRWRRRAAKCLPPCGARAIGEAGQVCSSGQTVIARSDSDDLSAVAQRAKAEAIHLSACAALWIASRSLSSGAHSRDPLARNDDFGYPRVTN